MTRGKNNSSVDEKIKTTQAQVTSLAREAKADRQSLGHLRTRLSAIQKAGALSLGSCADCSRYLKGILDPEVHPPQRYPDTFCERTSVFKSLNNVDITPRDFDALDLDSGEFRLMIFPEINNAIYELTANTSTAYASFSRNTELEGWILSPGETDNDSTTDGDAVLLQGRTLELRLTENNPGGELISSFPQGDVNGEVHEFFPMVRDANTSTVRVTVEPYQNANVGGGSGDIMIRQYTHGGITLATTTLPYTAATTSLTLELNLAQTNDRYAAHYIALWNTGNRIFTVKQTTCFIQSKYTWQPHELPDLGIMKLNIEKYRVVAQSSLLTYMSERLTAAGQVSSLLYRGGELPLTAGVSSYSEVARHLHSYNGPILDGTYTYWEPMDTSDMIFRPSNYQFTGKRPMTLISGLYSGTSGIPQNCLRLRVCTVIEFTSKAQMFEMEPSPVQPDWILMSNQVLAHVPNSMENGRHKNKLAKIASRLTPIVKKFGHLLWANRDPLMKIASQAFV